MVHVGRVESGDRVCPSGAMKSARRDRLMGHVMGVPCVWA